MSASRKIIIAGGSGLIGRALVARLMSEGADVVVLTRNPDHAPVAGALDVAWDGRRVERSWATELIGAAGIINLAGVGIGGRRWTQRRKDTILRSRVDATTALVAAIGQLESGSRPPVLVNASGIGYAGDSGDAEVTEEVAPGSSFLAGVCEEWEQAAKSATAHGTRVVCLRTSFVLARGALALRLLTQPYRLFLGGPLGDGQQWFPWIHIDDVVGLYLLALDDERQSGPLNAVAPDLRRQRDVARALGQALHRPARIPTPAPLLRAVLGEQADLLLHGQRARSSKLHGFTFCYPQLPDALAAVIG